MNTEEFNTPQPTPEEVAQSAAETPAPYQEYNAGEIMQHLEENPQDTSENVQVYIDQQVESNEEKEESKKSLVNQAVDHPKENLSESTVSNREEQEKARQIRLQIIEDIRSIYTQPQPGINLFQQAREIKQRWNDAPPTSKSDMKELQANYHHHMQGFYQLLDLHKEFREQEYAHNLEKRQQLIQRAKELQEEPVIQRAINELQHLHRLWKEEASPVSDTYHESTWLEFQALSNSLHERRLASQKEYEATQQNNLKAKLEVLKKLEEISTKELKGHSQWQAAMREMDGLREAFMAIGPVPKKETKDIWEKFKTLQRQFSQRKNTYYRDTKNAQQENLNSKRALIAQAYEAVKNPNREEATSVLKKLQNDWKEIGHVPRANADEIWTEFRSVCNTFFDNQRQERQAQRPTKRAKGDRSAQDNTQKGIRGQIAELENELKKIETNLSFFSNPSPDNPLLTSTYRTLEQKQMQLEALREKYKQEIIQQRSIQ